LILFDHVHAFADAAEHAVAPALDVLGLEVEEVVVGHVDEELGGGGVRVWCGPWRWCLVLEAVVGFVLDRGLGAFCFMPGSMPPPWIMKPLITRWKMVLS
jgi:hypothetical protein